MTRQQALTAHQTARRRGDTRAMHRTWIAARRATADEIRAELDGRKRIAVPGSVVRFLQRVRGAG